MSEATTPDVERLVSDYEDVLNRDFSKLDVISESFRYRGPGLPADGIRGREAFREFLETYQEAFSDLEYAIDDVLVSDEVAMLEWTVRGTHDGEFNGIPATDRDVEMRTMSKQVIVDGQIHEERGYYDTRSLLAQLGVTE